MKPAAALAVIAVGAILAFALKAPGGVISWSSAGWVLILTGIAGVLLPYLTPPALGPAAGHPPPRPAQAAGRVDVPAAARRAPGDSLPAR